MRHIAPPVLFSSAPLTYLASGAANNFYAGEGDNTNDGTDDPSLIIYWVIESVVEQEMPPRKLLTSEDSEELFGCKLIGFIPCSDIFGVDLILEKYQVALSKQKEFREASEKEQKDNIIVQLSERNMISINDDNYHPIESSSRRNHSRFKSAQGPAEHAPENLNTNIGLEMTDMDKSMLSSASFLNTMPFRVTTKAEE
jgi:hypothetical protein